MIQKDIPCGWQRPQETFRSFYIVWHEQTDVKSMFIWTSVVKKENNIVWCTRTIKFPHKHTKCIVKEPFKCNYIQQILSVDWNHFTHFVGRIFFDTTVFPVSGLTFFLLCSISPLRHHDPFYFIQSKNSLPRNNSRNLIDANHVTSSGNEDAKSELACRLTLHLIKCCWEA